MPGRKAVYREEHQGGYPLYRCEECGSEFYGGGNALHLPGCSRAGYTETTVIFGPACVPWVRQSQELGYETWCGVSIERLLACVPGEEP